jgi:hypothetical protein
VDDQLQLNPMLAPRWDLAIYRRGVLSLNPEEVNAIFDDKWKEKFARLCDARISRMTAPTFGTKNLERSQGTLFSTTS